MGDVLIAQEVEKEERSKKCANEIQFILQKYNCIMDVETTLSRLGVKFETKIIAQ
jgi:hypothetical protein